MKTIKIKQAGITSTDPTITLPDEIHLSGTGEATACHAESGDVAYPNLAELCQAYAIPPEKLLYGDEEDLEVEVEVNGTKYRAELDGRDVSVSRWTGPGGARSGAGGRRPGPGRPRVDEPRSVKLNVALTAREAVLIAAQAMPEESAGQTLRRLALEMASVH